MQDFSRPRYTVEPEIDDASLPGVSIQTASEMLGVSPSTIRRWCVTGHLRSQRVERPQGVAVRVFVESTTKIDAEHRIEGQIPSGDPLSRQAASDIVAAQPPMLEGGPIITSFPRALSRVTRAEQARAEMTIALMSATAAQVLTPFMKEFETVRGLSERQSGEIRQQAELIGRLSSDLDNAREVIREMTTRDQGRRGQSQWIITLLIINVALLAAAVAAGIAIWLMR